MLWSPLSFTAMPRSGGYFTLYHYNLGFFHGVKVKRFIVICIVIQEKKSYFIKAGLW